MVSDSNHPRLDLRLLLVRFPENADRIRKLASASAEFRELCEHYSLARAALERFLSQSIECRKPEVDDYRMVIADLEREIEDEIDRSFLGVT